MFAGPPMDLESLARGSKGLIARMVEEDQRREQRGPERLGDPVREGQEIAARITAGLTPSQQGPCAEFWEVRRRASKELGIQLDEADRADWLQDCERLPEAQRNCLSPFYQRTHQDECREVMEELTRRFRRETGIDLEHPSRTRDPRLGAQP
jgi:hypothetical protein